MLKIGFTGTQQGMSEAQFTSFVKVVQFLHDKKEEAVEFHHGDCIGADATAHHTFQEIFPLERLQIVIHPPLNSFKRAFCSSDHVLIPKDYITRNHDIVDAVQCMIATPKEQTEVLRSGTWATFRYAVKTHKPVFLISPEGNTEYVYKTRSQLKFG